jgi:hypothetical protein
LTEKLENTVIQKRHWKNNCGGGGGYKERVKEIEYGGCILCLCMKTEK